MSNTARHLSLLVPGLLGPVDLIDPARLPQLESLPLLLRRSKSKPANQATFEQLLFSLFQLSVDSSELPVAPLTYLNDSGASPADWCMRADPVYMEPGRTSLRLMSSAEAMQLTTAEADTLCDSLNRHFAPQGVRFEAPQPHRWYCFSQANHELKTTSLRHVQGQAVQAHMPGGEAGMFWHGILAEAQMLLHQHDVNQIRARQGLPRVNSLWLWGQGMIPVVTATQWQGIWATEPLVRALAQASSTPVYGRPEGAVEWLNQVGEGRHLLVLEHLLPGLPDLSQEMWSGFVTAVEEQWLRPLLQALHNKQLVSLDLYTGDGHCYHLTRSGLRHFWLRPRSLMAQLQQSDYE